ncbi:MAG: phage tail family protein [Clostridia bacterium]|nr:phage tail family protein [Clostridia bacterium]
MLYITYENEIGKLNLTGGSGRSPWHIIEAEGLGLTGKSYDTATFPGTVGQQTLSENVEPRTIIIQCDVHMLGGSRNEVTKALRILNHPGTLTIRDGIRARKINARCTNSAEGERNGGYKVFAFQFVCDYPYFEDCHITSVPVFKPENLIGNGIRWYLDGDGKLASESGITEGAFKLPCIFTRRISSSDVFNFGDVECEPVIRITVQGSQRTDVAAKRLIITNTSTNQQLILNYAAQEGDEITIDIPNRKIFDQKGTNLISYLDSSSFLSDFWLQKNDNIITVKNEITDFCLVICEFSNKYIEAVIE